MNLNRTPKRSDPERWRYVRGTYKRYSISTYGRIRSNLYRQRNSLGSLRYLQPQQLDPKPRTDNREGLWCKIVVNRRKRQVNIARLVATHFLYVPVGNPKLRHINGDKEDCHVANLEWIR